MTIIQTLLHYGSYLAAFYAFYLVAGALTFGFFVWQKVYLKDRRQPIPVRVRSGRPVVRDTDSGRY